MLKNGGIGEYIHLSTRIISDIIVYNSNIIGKAEEKTKDRKRFGYYRIEIKWGLGGAEGGGD